MKTLTIFLIVGLVVALVETVGRWWMEWRWKENNWKDQFYDE